ncbi:MULTISPECIES: sigma factor-like helix-turn-helix DNA-binding protein [unclassified Sporosarcina]|uniref:sigma factor-like helix-turn-helix DNA-binding protein n=1 Tax=unclassified Sporosarcina TaxID=2647733 RepID=UPI001A91C834|nr:MULTISPECIES: sigma factor-like helix-turn-helix DNA-binding protein [unclassified Sporosarcina]MBO0587619.1 hypothetical protein [Sporosarcina sp. E16_8]MBO0602391.1 hypothetical protein [Sporosarcina sp. E16_3]
MFETDYVLNNFLSIDENAETYRSYMENPTNGTREELDKQFKKYFYKIRCISYFIKMIHFESKHFDIKERKHRNNFVLSIDKENESGYRNIELIADHQHYKMDCKGNLEHEINDPVLYKAFQRLTDKQRTLLQFIYMDNMKDTEVAIFLGISQQAVTKAKRNALTRLRKEMSEVV